MFTKDSLTIDLGSSSNSILFETRQHDTLHLGFSVLNGGRVMDLSNHTIKIYCTDADGTEFRYSKGFEIQGKKFYLTLPEYFTNCLGKVSFEFEFSNENGVTTSPTYTYMVKARIKDENHVDLGTLDDLRHINDIAGETKEALDHLHENTLNTIEIGREVLNLLKESIQTSYVSKDNLVAKIEESVLKLNAMQERITHSQQREESLNQTISTAENRDEHLSSVIHTAEVTNEDLSSVINTANQSNTTLVQSTKTGKMSSSCSVVSNW